MAPLAFRVVLHGVYAMPYFVNPTAARKSGCTDTDIQLMMRLIPCAYSHTASYVRPFMTIRKAWHVQHKNALGSCPDHALIDALIPRRKNPEDTEKPSHAWSDYIAPTGLPRELEDLVESCVDLTES